MLQVAAIATPSTNTYHVMSGKRVLHPTEATKEFSHTFHWKRRWYWVANTNQYYWQSNPIYLYAPNKQATNAWTITNATPAPLVIQSATTSHTLAPNTTVNVPRDGRKRFTFYSYYTGQKGMVHTQAPRLTVHYAPTQDPLIVTKTAVQKTQ